MSNQWAMRGNIFNLQDMPFKEGSSYYFLLRGWNSYMVLMASLSKANTDKSLGSYQISKLDLLPAPICYMRE